MVSAGRVMLIPKGEYNALTTYNVLDMVSYNGSSYVAKTTTTGNLPTDTSKWMLMASSSAGQTFNDLSDVDFSNLTEGDLPIYDSISNEWKNTPTSAVTVTNNPISITTQSAQVARDTKITLLPIQAAGTPTPVNQIPIYGYDSVDLDAHGINQWDEEWENGRYKYATDGTKDNSVYNMIRNKRPIVVKSSTTYFFKTPFNGVMLYYEEDGSYIGYASVNSNVTFTTPANCKYICFYISSDYGMTYNHDISINYPSTDTSYHAYEGQTISLPLPSTVYGGEHDVERGVLKVTHGIVDLGDLSWIRSTSYTNPFFYAGDLGGLFKIENTNNGLCTCYKRGTNSDANSFGGNADDLSFAFNNVTGNQVYVRNDAYTDAAAFKTAMNGQTLVYELATPYEIPLTPYEVQLLKGANVITSNGTSVTLTYREGTIATLEDIPSETVNKLAEMVADVQGDISTLDSTKTDLSAIAPIEDGTTASQAYKVNEYFIRGGKLCKCISAISAGSTFTLNTNYVETTLAKEIPKYTVSTTDITPGVTPLPAGQFYIVLL